MVKPTVLQKVLNRPSKTYSFPQEKAYFSAKQELTRAATEGEPQTCTPADIVSNDIKHIDDAVRITVHPSTYANSSRWTCRCLYMMFPHYPSDPRLQSPGLATLTTTVIATRKTTLSQTLKFFTLLIHHRECQWLQQWQLLFGL
jgi:hypothetical protein